MIDLNEFIDNLDTTGRDLNKIISAYKYAKYHHSGQTRKFENQPYLIHPIRVALKLKDENDDLIIAALLHDIIEKTDQDKTNIQHKFGKIVADLVDGMSKSADRRMFEALELYIDEYPELIKIRMADRLDNMKTKFKFLPRKTQLRYQQETEQMLDIAKSIGIDKFVTDLTNISTQSTIT